MSTDKYIEIGISLAGSLFMAGIAVGAMRATVKGLSDRLDQHIEASGTWRTEQATRVENLSTAFYNFINRRN